MKARSSLVTVQCCRETSRRKCPRKRRRNRKNVILDYIKEVLRSAETRALERRKCQQKSTLSSNEKEKFKCNEGHPKYVYRCKNRRANKALQHLRMSLKDKYDVDFRELLNASALLKSWKDQVFDDVIWLQLDED